MQDKNDRCGSAAWRQAAWLLASCLVAVAVLPSPRLSPMGSSASGAEIMIDAKIVSVRVTIS